ncbi:3D domain-containing protein [Desulfosporosinus sp. FKA]|uniref:G5 and 3D domain-containing protein n=1 Tax=Desulfosporosinus sp. FKA TaxID=1969834 RepID=UPI001FA92654|nr:3D domain-containing protein [Desulfosporosinus sp. FKA]
MYSLPITTYSDYWRATKTWSSYLGGLAVFAAGTRYSALKAPDISQTMSVPYQQVKQPQTIQKPKLEIGLLDSRRKLLRVGNISRGAPVLGGSNLKSRISEPSSLEVVNDAGKLDTAETLNQVKDSNQNNFGETSQKEHLSEDKSIKGSGSMMTSDIQVVDKEIAYDTQVIESDQLLPGMSKVQEEGETGVLRQVVKTYKVDGQPLNQQIQLSFELKRPKKKVVIQNSKPVVGEHFDIDKLNISKTLTMESTAYTYTGNKTATGLTPRQGIIAVDPRVIAMGSKVYVEGYGYAIAADTGGDIKGNRIDLFFTNLRQCLDWGRKPVRIHILKPI